VGDILKVEDTHKFAADMVILSTSASTGKFFVMTANLDGETNLKPMSAARLTKHCRVSHTGRKLLLSVREPYSEKSVLEKSLTVESLTRGCIYTFKKSISEESLSEESLSEESLSEESLSKESLTEDR
jgi:magnesium-transporting ATPase (P-type)